MLVVQEVWRPDGERGVVDDFAAEHGYKQHDLTLSRSARCDPLAARIPPDGQGTFGLAVLSRLPASVVGQPRSAQRGPIDAGRRVLQLAVEVADTRLTSPPSI